MKRNNSLEVYLLSQLVIQICQFFVLKMKLEFLDIICL